MMSAASTPGPMGAPASTAAVAPAATVLLLREAATGEIEVLMTKRAAGLTFMGGLWVFPGGRMETADMAAGPPGSVASRLLEAVRRRMLDRRGEALPLDVALGLHVAACRETFEESGVLLAHARPEGASLEAAQLARLATRRSEGGDATAFRRLLAEENLVLDLDRLVYWAHWITPSLERRRFDTRFFAVRVPPGQEVSVDRSETTRHAWLGERAIRESLASGEMKMAPPTQVTLEDLWRSHGQHGGLDAMLDAEREREVPPILPKMIARSASSGEVVLPWDPQYDTLPGEAGVVRERYPDYLATVPSRVAFHL
jgi:8-oxo-dGTP pyrophosphatase MutT (NUDIX family)